MTSFLDRCNADETLKGSSLILTPTSFEKLVIEYPQVAYQLLQQRWMDWQNHVQRAHAHADQTKSMCIKLAKSREEALNEAESLENEAKEMQSGLLRLRERMRSIRQAMESKQKATRSDWSWILERDAVSNILSDGFESVRLLSLHPGRELFVLVSFVFVAWLLVHFLFQFIIAYIS